MSTVSFIVEFMKLKYYAKTDDKAAVRLLEDNIHPHICYQLFSMGRRSNNYDATLTAIKEIGSNLEAYRMYLCTGQEASHSKMINQIESIDFGPGPGGEKDVGALSWDNKKKKGKGTGGKPPAPRGNKCFNCGQEGHNIKDCRKPKNRCDECKCHSSSHWTGCSKYIARVHTTTAEQATAHSPSLVPKDPFTTVHGMDFEQMQAYFWDKKDLTEKQGKGKAQ